MTLSLLTDDFILSGIPFVSERFSTEITVNAKKSARSQRTFSVKGLILLLVGRLVCCIDEQFRLCQLDTCDDQISYAEHLTLASARSGRGFWFRLQLQGGNYYRIRKSPDFRLHGFIYDQKLPFHSATDRSPGFPSSVKD